ncbi:hypothetical protein [Rhizobium leguminosarum]|uniref:hypothetical protein n=1 Tax=Rhizobium leguminosarum TaxID=384 RepID=UPI001C959DCD|nr:hypothetical protein [Rhizobium leguminosarum]MBY5827841.1 hypothetical protein [Rhizobium leguminosarum]
MRTADFAYERLIGTPAELSHNPGKFQLPLAQNRGALQNTAGANSNWIKLGGKVTCLDKDPPAGASISWVLRLSVMWSVGS